MAASSAASRELFTAAVQAALRDWPVLQVSEEPRGTEGDRGGQGPGLEPRNQV